MRKTEKEVEREHVAREIYLRLVAQRLGEGSGDVPIEEIEDLRLAAHTAADVWVGDRRWVERIGLSEVDEKNGE